MNNLTGTSEAVSESSLDVIATEYLKAVEAGDAPDRAGWLARHPALATELADFFADLDRMERLAPPLRFIADAAGADPSAPDGLRGRMGDYQLLREVGRGGMGIVYEAEQLSLGRRVALKVLPFAATMDPKHLQRFKNEAKAAASLKHEHIVPIYAVGCERGVHYYAMEFIEGQTLAQLIAGRAGSRERPVVVSSSEENHGALTRPRSPDSPTAPVAALSTERTGPKGRAFYRTAAGLIADAADALEHAHSVGIIHRDVKPANLLLDAAGQLYVSDFGLARVGPDAGLTVSGDLVGTLRYMAPEQALAKHGLVDHRADVYALGATLYELLTGRPAVDATDRAEILRRIAFEDPALPRKLDKSVPAELETVTLKALAKNPSERYATAGDLADDLRRWLGDQTIKAKPPTLTKKTVKWIVRHKHLTWAAAAVGLVGVAAVAALAGLAWHKNAQITAAYTEAEQGRQLTRQALDELSSQVIDDWLSQQGELRDEHKAFLQRALSHYERFAASTGGDEKSRAGVAAACLRVGGIRGQLGQVAAAEEAYTRGRKLFEQLTTEYAAQPAYRAGLASSHWELGELLIAQAGRQAAAEQHLRQGLALLEKLAAEFPHDPRYRSELGMTCACLGIVRGKTGHVDEAEQSYRRALALLQGLDVEDPARGAMHRGILASTHKKLGDVLETTGRPSEAEQSYQQAIALLERLVADHPTVPKFRLELADSHLGRAVLLWRMGRRDQAVQSSRRVNELFQKLADDFPTVPAYRASLATGLNNLGAYQKDAGRLPEAGDCFRRVIELRRKLAEEFPAEFGHRHQLALGHWNLGIVRTEMGERGEAEQFYRNALALQKELVADAPDVPEYRSLLARICKTLGVLLKHAGQQETAAAALREAVAVQAQLVDRYPTVPEYRVDLSDIYSSLSFILSGTSRWADAEQAARQCLALREHLAHDFPTVPRYRYSLAGSHYSLGLRASSMSRTDDEQESYRRAIPLLEQLVRDDPGRPDYRDLLSRCYINLGNVLNAIGRPQEAEQSNRQGLALLEKLTADAPGVPQYRDNQAVGYENLGDIQFHAGRRQEAEQSYRQGLALLEKLAADAPGIPRYQYRLANWLADCADPALRDPGRAAVVAQRAVELAPADGKHWLTLGKAKYRTGAWQESAAALRKALERHPGDASDWFFLAMAHWQMGQPGEARQWSDQAVEWMDKNKPNDAELRRIRAEAAELLKEKSGDTDKK